MELARQEQPNRTWAQWFNQRWNGYKNYNFTQPGTYLVEAPFRAYKTPGARHSMVVSIATPEQIRSLPDSERRKWTGWSPDDLQRPTVFVRAYSYSHDKSHGKEAYWPTIRYLLQRKDSDDVYQSANQPIKVWGWDPKQNSWVTKEVRNTSLVLPPSHIAPIQLVRENDGSVSIQRRNNLMNFGDKYVREHGSGGGLEAYKNTCHKQTTATLGLSPDVIPGSFRSGGPLGGKAVTGGGNDVGTLVPWRSFNVKQNTPSENPEAYGAKPVRIKATVPLKKGAGLHPDYMLGGLGKKLLD